MWGRAAWAALVGALHLFLAAAFRLGSHTCFLPELHCTYAHTWPGILLIWILTVTHRFDFLAWPRTCFNTMDLSVNPYFWLTRFTISRPVMLALFRHYGPGPCLGWHCSSCLAVSLDLLPFWSTLSLLLSDKDTSAVMLQKKTKRQKKKFRRRKM